MAHDVWVTGYGLLSAAGEAMPGAAGDAVWDRLQDANALTTLVDSESFKPYHLYPVADYDLGRQVPKRGDQRAMGPMMQYGAYACGLALEAAGVAGDEALLGRMELVAAAGCGERDPEVDGLALDLLETNEEPWGELNRLLSDELRPTLFLAQLPNLFAGNISIIHGVSGATRTFIGDEAAGIDAFRIGFERIAAGQGDLFLVGAAFNALRPDILSMYQAGELLLTEPLCGLWQRPAAGICLGSAGAFLVIESAEGARARGAAPLARVAAVVSDRCDRSPGAAAAKAAEQLAGLRDHLRSGELAVMSGASGAGALTGEERAFLAGLADAGLDCAVRGTAAALGHTVEASFMANVILGVSCLERGAVFPPLAPGDPLEEHRPESAVTQALVTGWGPVHGEGMAILEAIDGD